MLLSLEPSTGIRFGVAPVATMSCAYETVFSLARTTLSAAKSIDLTSCARGSTVLAYFERREGGTVARCQAGSPP